MAFQGDSIYWVEVEKIVPNPFQPRREFDEAKLKELSESIRMYGVLQPLTVTRKEVQRGDGTFYTEYELIAGERRLRASKLAGVGQVPVLIRDGEETEQEKLELAIIENLQREDLNAVDRALAFKQLANEFEMSHAEVAKKVGRSREYVSNSIRLLALPEHMLSSLKRGEMMEGHARTLLMLTDKPEEQEVVFKEILLKKLSVREVERIVRKIATDKVRKKNPGEFDSELIEMEKQFTETLGTRVQIQKTDFGGKLTIDYFSVEDLEGLLARVRAEVAETGVSEGAAIAAAALSAHTPLDVVDDIVPDVPDQDVDIKTDVSTQAIGKQEEQSLVADISTAEPEPEVVQEPELASDNLAQPVEQELSPKLNDEPAPLIDEPQSAPEVTQQPSSGLSDALARAIGFSRSVSSESVAEKPAANPDTGSSEQSKPQLEVAETNEATSNEETSESKSKPNDEHEDDSSLYSINRFTV